jgi:TRAP-type C4-dicarboxylate transport system substrate-binding protein
LHHSGTLGSERDAVEFMIQGVAVDFYVISPAWIATWERTAPIVDAPFVFRDADHWLRVIEQGAFKPMEETLLRSGLRILGWGGGSTRHLISRIPANTIDDFPRIRLRVQGSPIHQRAFSAAGFQATPLEYLEVYNAIATGVLDALENEPAGVQTMRFFEVAPYYVLTNHQIQTRPLIFSERRFQTFPRDVQDAILRAGLEAAAFHRDDEIGEEETITANMARLNGLRVIQFDNTEMRRRAMPAVEAFAEEIGAGGLLRAIQGIP